MVRPWTTATLLVSLVGSCGFIDGGDDSHLPVVVVAGIDGVPADSNHANGAYARYVQDRESVVYVSGLRYSSSCVPDGEATQQGDVVTLVVDDEHDGYCTSDAGRATFTIENVSDAPAQLIVQEPGQQELRLDLSD